MKNFILRLFGLNKTDSSANDSDNQKANNETLQSKHEAYIQQREQLKQQAKSQIILATENAQKIFADQLAQGLFSFEIHLTVNQLTLEQLDNFSDLCTTLDGKAIIIELPYGETLQQPMFTQTLVCHDKSEVYEHIEALKHQLQAQGYPIIREKVEIPNIQYQKYIENYQEDDELLEHENCYFEWHGKFQYEHQSDLNSIHDIATNHDAHVSKNQLINDTNTRFVTIRAEKQDEFLKKVADFLDVFQNQYSCFLIKSQYEYCIFDNKTVLDRGWAFSDVHNILSFYQKDFPEMTDYGLKEFIAHEAFIRRASQVDMPFMLKGSFVTRQYFKNPKDRMPADIDYVCLHHDTDLNNLENLLSSWVQQITEMPVDDGIYFISFAENRFWRRIEYAMHDDFPTVMTDLTCFIDGEKFEFMLDVSLNLEMPVDPVRLDYKSSLRDFVIPRSVPLAVQIAWKLHQCIVRPRIKDIYDLAHLALAVDNETTLLVTLQTLYEECQKDKITKDRMLELFNYQYEQLFIDGTAEYHFENAKKYDKDYLILLPDSFDELFIEFSTNMQNSGYTRQFVKDFFNSEPNY